jgi:hypothetical protein
LSLALTLDLKIDCSLLSEIAAASALRHRLRVYSHLCPSVMNFALFAIG